eukprot:1559491-Alexandrium_andersonii.AAC.1
MSASLVGSEMCIRDRCCTGHAAGGWRAETELPGSQESWSIPSCPPSLENLLSPESASTCMAGTAK